MGYRVGIVFHISWHVFFFWVSNNKEKTKCIYHTTTTTLWDWERQTPLWDFFPFSFDNLKLESLLETPKRKFMPILFVFIFFSRERWRSKWFAQNWCWAVCPHPIWWLLFLTLNVHWLMLVYEKRGFIFHWPSSSGMRVQGDRPCNCNWLALSFWWSSFFFF